MRLVREVRPGVWHWQAPHPEWKQGEEWGPEVSSYAIDDGVGLVLVDPLAVPPAVEEHAAERETAIVLTCPWHRRDALELAQRLDAPIHVPPPDVGEPEPAWGRVFRAGDPLPVGAEARAGAEPNDLVLWIESHAALVAGDTLVDLGHGLQIPAGWVTEPVERVRERLLPLLGLPFDLVLATHGGPHERGALERALA